MDSTEVEVAFVPRLVDEDDLIGKALVACFAFVSLLLVPVLERRGDQVDLEPVGDKHFRELAETGVAARFVAQFHAHCDNRQTFLRGLRLRCDVASLRWFRRGGRVGFACLRKRRVISRIHHAIEFIKPPWSTIA